MWVRYHNIKCGWRRRRALHDRRSSHRKPASRSLVRHTAHVSSLARHGQHQPASLQTDTAQTWGRGAWHQPVWGYIGAHDPTDSRRRDWTPHTRFPWPGYSRTPASPRNQPVVRWTRINILRPPAITGPWHFPGVKWPGGGMHGRGAYRLAYRRQLPECALHTFPLSYHQRTQARRYWWEPSFLPSSLPSFLHSIIPPSSFMHFLLFVPSFIHSFIHSSIHLHIHAFIHVTLSFLNSHLCHTSYPSIHSSIHSFIHASIHSFIHPHSLVNSWNSSTLLDFNFTFTSHPSIHFCLIHIYVINMINGYSTSPRGSFLEIWLMFVVEISRQIIYEITGIHKKCLR